MTSGQVDHPQQPPASAISDRPRTPAKYSSLGRRRVPTGSNNGQNHTYERLEDLLREAGYKETRIFTPESNQKSRAAKVERAGDPELHPRRNSAVGAVVGFFAGFIPSTTVEGRSSFENQQQQTYHSPSSSTGRPEPTSPSPSTKKRSLRNDLSATKGQLPHPSDRLRPHLSLEASSQAHAYLRHMVSAPNIHAVRRTQSTRTASVGRRHQMNSRSNTDPPLPQTWLQNVTKAVLFGGEGAHAGGPHSADVGHPHIAQAGPSTHDHSPLRSSRLNQSMVSNDTDPSNALGDSTNRVRNLRPGVELMAGKVRVGRPSRSESQVAHTAVLCRSAPASRASSRVRGGDTGRSRGHDQHLDVAAMMDLLVNDDSERQTRGRWQSRSLKKKRDNVPSLARTHTTGDSWNVAPRRPLQRHTSMLSPTQRRGLGLGDDDDEDGHVDSDDSDDEGTELNLAQLLVPPKRQNSIRSLRKHLDVGVRHSYHPKQKQRAETDVDDDTDDYLTWSRPAHRTLGKSKRGVIPGWSPDS